MSQQHLLLEMSRTGEIIKMWKSTGVWEKVSETKRNNIMQSLKTMMQTTNNDYNYVMWFARCIQRGLLVAAGEVGAKKLKVLLNDNRPFDRAAQDFNFFVGSNASAFFQMINDIKKTAVELEQEPVFLEVPDIRNGVQQMNPDGTPKMRREKVDLLASLDSIKLFNDVRLANGNVRQLDRSTKQVYDDINKVMAPLGEGHKLPKGERLITFKNGVHWTNTGIQTCKIEGAMMGHCGNAAPKPGDTIVSLRVPATNAMFAPEATFIYNTNSKAFGEMKGKRNEKPAVEHHEYIVGLLSKSNYEKGNVQIELLQGGGYRPDNNFSLNDLSEPLFKQLCQANADLIANQIKNGNKVSREQQLDQRHLKWAKEIVGEMLQQTDDGTLKYMQDQ